MANQDIRVRENSLDVKSASESDFVRVVGANGKSYRVEMQTLKRLIASVEIDGSTEDLQEAIDTILEKTDAIHTYYGTCDTDTAIMSKIVVCPDFKLETGAKIAVKFTSQGYGTGGTFQSLNVNNTGAKYIQYRGSFLTLEKANLSMNKVYEFVYDGTYYNLVGDLDTKVTVDSALSDTSTNPVQNKVVKAAVDDLKEDLSELTDRVIDIGDNTTLGLYGAKWDRLTDRLTRLFQAADITIDTTNFCHKGALNTNYDNPFDSIYPWSEMKVCNVDLTKYRSGNYSLKDCITAVYGDPDFTYEGTETIFVGRYRPEFWYKSMEDGDGNVYYLVSQIERTGFEHAPEAIDGISFCVDAGNSKVTAGSGIPLTNIAVSQIHARAKNSGFTLQDIYTIDQQIILYLVEYANMNIQNAIGNGCSSCYRENDADTISNVTVTNGETTFDVTDSAMAQYMQVGCQIDIGATRGAVTYKGLLKSYSVSGTTCTITLDRELAVTNGMFASVHGFSACEYDMIAESIGNASGYIGTNNKANAFYRGALLYANRYSYILGVYRQTGTNRIWLCPKDLDPDDYDAINTSVHSDTGVALPDLAADAWVTVGGNAQRIDGLSAFMATGESSGSSASPVGDQQYVPVPSAGNTILLFGCYASRGWSCGVFGGYWRASSGNSWWDNAGLPILK